MVELGFEPRYRETGMQIKRVRDTRMQILEGPTQTCMGQIDGGWGGERERERERESVCRGSLFT